MLVWREQVLPLIAAVAPVRTSGICWYIYFCKYTGLRHHSRPRLELFLSLFAWTSPHIVYVIPKGFRKHHELGMSTNTLIVHRSLGNSGVAAKAGIHKKYQYYLEIYEKSLSQEAISFVKNLGLTTTWCERPLRLSHLWIYSLENPFLQ